VRPCSTAHISSHQHVPTVRLTPALTASLARLAGGVTADAAAARASQSGAMEQGGAVRVVKVGWCRLTLFNPS
jgi:hypothetical protein